MSFSWKDFVEVAKLLKNEDGEAYLRSAVSRAYYAACCTLRDALGIRERTGRVHSQIVNRVRTTKRTKSMYYAALLEKLRVLRNECDYESSYKIKLKQVEVAISHAEELIEFAEELLNDGATSP